MQREPIPERFLNLRERMVSRHTTLTELGWQYPANQRPDMETYFMTSGITVAHGVDKTGKKVFVAELPEVSGIGIAKIIHASTQSRISPLDTRGTVDDWGVLLNSLQARKLSRREPTINAALDAPKLFSDHSQATTVDLREVFPQFLTEVVGPWHTQLMIQAKMEQVRYVDLPTFTQALFRLHSKNSQSHQTPEHFLQSSIIAILSDGFAYLKENGNENIAQAVDFSPLFPHITAKQQKIFQEAWSSKPSTIMENKIYTGLLQQFSALAPEEQRERIDAFFLGLPELLQQAWAIFWANSGFYTTREFGNRVCILNDNTVVLRRQRQPADAKQELIALDRRTTGEWLMEAQQGLLRAYCDFVPAEDIVDGQQAIRVRTEKDGPPLAPRKPVVAWTIEEDGSKRILSIAETKALYGITDTDPFASPVDPLLGRAWMEDIQESILDQIPRQLRLEKDGRMQKIGLAQVMLLSMVDSFVDTDNVTQPSPLRLLEEDRQGLLRRMETVFS